MEKIVELVDEGYALQTRIRQLSKRLDEIKKEVRSYASRYKKSNVEGSKAVATASTYSTTDCDPDSLHDKLVELGREHEFTQLVKVAIGPSKKALGESIFSEISHTVSGDFYVIRFKKKT